MIVLVIFLIFFLTYQAHAYLNPGMGSMLVQVIVSGIAGILTIFRLYWKRHVRKVKETDEPKQKSFHG